MKSLAVDLDAVLGDTRPLWDAWVADVSRRTRVELELPFDRAAAVAVLDEHVPGWPALLERFAENHAPVYLRRDPAVNAALRRLRSAGVRVSAVTDAPAPLVRVATAQLGVDVLLGPPENGATEVRTRDELLRLAP